jgi:DNA repair protein RecO (recombination protein O)
MDWTDDGIVMGTRRHGEANAILELMTRAHGRHLGLVRGGAGSRMRPILQPGNSVRAVWRARIDEHLGHYTVEGIDLRAGALLSSPHAVYAINLLGALVRLLPERDPHETVFDDLAAIMGRLGAPVEAAVRIARFELALLAELGFGLDLDSCAATGTTEDLVFVSPKSGRAVSRLAGEPWRDRLLKIPPFLASDAEQAPLTEVADGFALTGFFLARHAFEPRGQSLPDSRAQFVASIMRGAAGAGAKNRGAG